MKTLIIYDSQYGNTEQIAKAIGGGIKGEVKLVRAGDADPTEIPGAGLLIIGSPTQGGRATEAMTDFLEKLPDASLKCAPSLPSIPASRPDSSAYSASPPDVWARI
jgi:flavodoxin